MERFDSVDSNCSDYEVCCLKENGCGLKFDYGSLENVILNISDTIDLRVMLGNEGAQKAMLVTTGLALAGSIVGKHYGGRVGAAVGGAVGGACGLGIVAVSMRDIWEDVKARLTELFDLVYDYLAGLGIDDYRKAAMFLAQSNADSTQLALIMVQVVSEILGKKVVTSLTAS